MECLKLITVYPKGVAQKVPCGKCAFCLQNKRSQWMFRVYHEMRTQEYPGWFITLTYDERHVKRLEDGRLSLRFRDVQLFLKQVRKRKYYAKYVCVGEYGGQTKRPHYHLLIWTDCPPETLECIWRRGQIHFGRITMASAMYTLKYIIQPKQSNADGLEKTRAQFSKGIGLAYLDTAMYEYHTFDYDRPVFTSIIDGNQVALPRYYKNKIFTKWQLREERRRQSYVRVKETRKIYRKFRARGVKNIRAYVKTLRLSHASQILSTTKYGTTL